MAIPVIKVKRGLPILKDIDCPFTGTEEARLTLVNQGLRTHKISFLGKGKYGCAYKVLGPQKSVQFVAKTARLDNEEQDFPDNELDALEAIGELYDTGYDRGGKEWVLMKYHPGQPVIQTKKWQERFPEGYNTDTSPQAIEDCTTFMKGLYTLVAQKQRWYAYNFGWESGDLNWLNFLFADDLKTVNIIDWSLASSIDDSNETPDAIYQRWLEVLETQSLLPIKDINTNGYGKVQGICESKARDFGTPWVPRLEQFAGPTVGLSLPAQI